MARVRPRLIDLKTLISIAILFSLLLFKLVASDVSDTSIIGSVSVCLANYTETIDNRTELVDDKFKVNLQTLLTDLASTSAATPLTPLSFYNTTAGESPNKSYGIYLCRGDVTTSELCRSCVTNLTNWVTSFDANCTERVAYTDFCMIRYANYSFFGRAHDRDAGYTYDKFATTDVYNRTLVRVVEQVITIAAYNSSALFATYEAPAGEAEKVYALAQCTPDIDRGSCSGCLKAAQSYLQHNATGDPKFAWAMRTSCQLRYDNASFFASHSDSAPPPVPAFLVVTLGLFFIDWLMC